MNQVYIVVGPEASGTRFVTNCLISAGCFGDSGHTQRLDSEVDTSKDLLVFRRSLPHAKDWPDIGQLVNKFKVFDYSVKLLIMVRDVDCLIQSQLRNKHTPDRERAIAHIEEAYRMIGKFIAENPEIPFHYVPYESLLEPCGIRSLLTCLNLPTDKIPVPKDGNKKYQKK